MRRDHTRRWILGRLGSAGLAAIFSCIPVVAHVQLDSPNGGEVYEVGATVTVTWHVLIEHPMENWDLWYSTEGLEGHYIPIATDLPTGDPAIDSVHTFEWTVPGTVSGTVRVRVRQDLGGAGYYDTSDADFAIVPLQSTERLHVLRLSAPFPGNRAVFEGPPCSRISDLRICTEAPGVLESVDEPSFPLAVADDGDLVMIEFDSDLAAAGTPDSIAIDKGPEGELRVDLF